MPTENSPQLILNNIEEIYLLINKELKLIDANKAAFEKVEKYFNLPLIRGMNVLELTPPDQWPRLIKIYTDVFEGRHHMMESEVTGSDGTKICFKNELKPVRNEEQEIVGGMISFVNITEIKKAEHEFVQMEHRWQFALEGGNQGVWDWNMKTGEVYYSHTWKRLLGFEDDEIKNHIDEWKKRIHPNDKKRMEGEVEKHIESSNPFYETTQRLKAKDGTYRWILARGMLIDRATDGTPLRMVGTHTDITKQKNVEEGYKLLFYSNPLPMWIFDLNTLRFLEVNEEAIRHYGYSREEFLNMTIKEIHVEENIAQVIEAVNKNRDAKKIVISKWKQHKKNGEEIWVNLHGNTITYNGRQARLITAHDITAKVDAEQQLKKSNERFRLATKATSDAIYDWDLLVNDLKWGEGMYTLFGYQSDEVTIDVWESFIHPEDRKRVGEDLKHTIEKTKKKYWKQHYQFKKANGEYGYVLDRGFIVRDEEGKPLRMIGAMQDVSEQKLKEQQLLQSNERFDAIMKATHDLIWDWNLETGSFYRDKEGVKKVYGVKDEESISNINLWLQRIHPDDQHRVQVVVKEILQATNADTFDVEYRFRRDDDTYTHVYDRGTILRNATGKPIRMVGAAQDITERKRLENELLQRELDKQKLISQATIETQEMERSVIGRELHDNVNQVLTTTKLYLDLSLSSAELKDELIEKSKNNIMYVINEIRQLSRSLMNPSLGDLGLIDSIQDLIESVNVTKKINVILDADPKLEEVLSENYKLMIFRIIQESLNNAIKHARANTVLITIDADEKTLFLDIEDNGIGFQPQLVKKGSGLMNIQNRVYLANGSVTIKSEPEKGSKIKINFPLHQKNPD